VKPLLFTAALLLGSALSARAEESLEALAAAGAMAAEQCEPVVQRFTERVELARANNPAVTELAELRAVGDGLHNACRAGIAELEASAGEDERKLEALFRSRQWYDINRALAQYRYLQAWLDFSLATASVDEEQRIKALARAQRGFEAASLRLLFPGIVYGSGLGLALIDRTNGDDEAAKAKLLVLERALAADPESPVAVAVTQELRLMTVESDDALAWLEDGADLAPEEARVIEERVFVLLARQREQGVGAMEAAELLRRLIAAGHLDGRLFQRLMTYRDEIVGTDLGVLSLLVDAEFAYAYGQFETCVFKIRELRRTGVELPFDMAPYDYHFAVALLQISLVGEAESEVLSLEQRSDLPTAVALNVIKLKFVIAEAVHRKDPDAQAAAELRRRALRYIEALPDDPELPRVYLTLAKLETDEQQRQAFLALARKDKKLKDAIDALDFEAAVSRFQAITAGLDERRLAASATEALDLQGQLKKAQRETLAVRLVVLQLRAVLDGPEETFWEDLQALEQTVPLNNTQQRVVAWSRLRYLLRNEGAVGIMGYLERSTVNTALQYELFSLLRAFELAGRDQELARISGAWWPRLDGQTQLQRQVGLMHINTLDRSGDIEAAYETTKALLALFPDSGDVWRRRAELSEATGRFFEAERAWAHMAGRAPEGSPVWLDALGAQLALLASQPQRSEEACSVASRLIRYSAGIGPETEAILDTIGPECRVAAGSP